MKAYLFDTHTFLWWSLEPDRLPGAVRQVLTDPDARVVFSVVSSWEARIKAGLGKLELSDPLHTIVERELVRTGPRLFRRRYVLGRLTRGGRRRARLTPNGGRAPRS